VSMGGRPDAPDPMDSEPHRRAVERVNEMRQALVALRLQPEFQPPLPPRRLSELQHDLLEANRALRDAGLPAGHP
jgi:hypothetical protein